MRHEGPIKLGKPSEKTGRTWARKFRISIMSTKTGMVAAKAKPVCNPGQDIHTAGESVVP
jgi:hypothetical protein